jgi:nitrite reductase/ring-hydroxylating ferredoxin subunit
MTGGQVICTLEELPDPGSRAFEIDGIACFLVRRDDVVRAYLDRCPHIGAPLAWSPDGYLDADGALVQCGMHGALFLPDSGECVHGPCVGDALTPVPIRIDQGRVLLDPADLPELD